MQRRDEDLDLLLSKGEITGPTFDRIFDHIERSVEDSRRSKVRRLTWRSVIASFLTLSTVGVTAAVVLRTTEFRTKGNRATHSEGSVSLTCLEGSLDACVAGSHLVFAAKDVEQASVLCAFAVNVLDANRIWYFDKSSGCPAVPPREGTQVVGREVVLGNEHPPGTYDVFMVLAHAPLSRDDLAQRQAQTGRDVIRARLVINSSLATPPGPARP